MAKKKKAKKHSKKSRARKACLNQKGRVKKGWRLGKGGRCIAAKKKK